jgi:hypothetical protein
MSFIFLARVLLFSFLLVVGYGPFSQLLRDVSGATKKFCSPRTQSTGFDFLLSMPW